MAFAAREDDLPVEITGLQEGGGLVGAIIEHHRGAHPEAAIGVVVGHVGSADAVVLEMLVVSLHAARLHAFGDLVADRLRDHGRDQPGFHTRAVGEVGRDVIFRPARVDLTNDGFGNRARCPGQGGG